MVRERSLNAQTVALALGTVVAQLLMAVLFILTARAMDPAEFGTVVTTIALGMVGAGLLDLGSSSYWIRELASGRTSLDELMPKLAAKFFIACGIAVVSTVVSAILYPRFIAAGLLLLSTSTIGTVLVPLRAARRTELVGLLTALDRLAAVSIYFTLTSIGVGPGDGLWISIVLGDFLLITYVSVTEFSRMIPAGLRHLSNPWGGARWYSLNAIGSSAAQLDLPLLAMFGGSTAAGIYGGVNRWASPLGLATLSFASAAAPYIAAQTAFRDARPELFRASRILLLVVIVSAGAIPAAPWLVVFLLGNAYAESAVVLQWLAGAVILNAIVSPLMVTLMSRQFDHFASVVLFLSVCAQLAFIAGFAGSMGAVSAAVGFFICQLLQLVGSVVSIALIARRRKR